MLLTFAALKKPTLNPDQVAALGLCVMFVGDKSEGSQSVQLHNVSGFLPSAAGIRFISRVLRTADLQVFRYGGETAGFWPKIPA